MLRCRFVILALLLLLGACTARQPVETVADTPVPDAELVQQLAGPLWVAEYINGKPVVDMSHTSMVFTAEGRVSGLGGCNHYSGGYTLKGGSIVFGPMAATMKMCAKALSDQEMRFFQSLAKPQKVSFENGLLKLTPDEGEPSVFGVQN